MMIRTFLYLLGLSSLVLAVEPPAAVTSSQWQGHEQESFTLEGRDCRVVRPARAAPGTPWIWRPEFFDAFNQADLALANEGFHLCYIDLKNSFGCPSSLDVMDRFYDHVTKTYHVSKKASLFGFSRGGLYSMNWASRHPDRVAMIYLDAAVCDFKSWPAGKGKGTGSPGDWQKLLVDYGFKSEEEALRYGLNPIDHLKEIAAARIPILSVCGDADTAVPYLENSAILKERYLALGGKMKVILKPGGDHHPHSLVDPTPIVEAVKAANAH
jgi:pimeloyl-ACP methyl ester carboxylesterase